MVKYQPGVAHDMGKRVYGHLLTQTGAADGQSHQWLETKPHFGSPPQPRYPKSFSGL
jgi:hypothetical protein